MPQAQVLVTGGGGFIGAHLVERLVSDGYRVRVLDNFATGRRSNLLHLSDEIELLEGDIQSYERVHNAVRGCELVYHLAALPSVPRSIQDPLTSNASNVTGVLNVLLAGRDERVRRVVYASSSSVYGASPALPKQEHARPDPISPYAVAKLAGENYCRSFARVYGLETVAIRYFNVFGPRQDPQSQYAAVVPTFILALMEGRSPTIFGDGEQSRDFTFVDNVVDANVQAADAEGVSGQVYNVACGQRVTLNELLAELNDLLGTSVEPVHRSKRPGDILHSQADIGRAQVELGYEPRVSLREGLSLTVAYYRDSSVPQAVTLSDG